MFRGGVDAEPRSLTPDRVGADTHRAADADVGFQWPPPKDDSAGEVFPFPVEGSKPNQAHAAVALEPGPGGAVLPDGSPQARGDREGEAYQRLQEALRSSTAPPEAKKPIQKAARTSGTKRPPRSLAGIFNAAAVALLVLIAGVEGAYIVRLGWLRTASGSAVVADAPVVAGSEAVPTENGGAPPKTASTGVVGTSTAPVGRLSISSEPSGAEVFIDGRAHGRTPLTLAAVKPGDRRVVLKIDGREVRQTVRVEAGGTAALIAPMSQPTVSSSGWITVASAAELDVFENGVLVGTTRSPQLMLPAGLHTLRFVNEVLGYEDTRQVRVGPGKVARVSLTLPESTIHLNAQPWADVWIDGTSVGETPIGNLAVRIGTHEIRFRHPELGEKTVTTVVKAGAPTRVTVDFRK